MTDTPRTDAVWADKGQNILEHARTLERELALANERVVAKQAAYERCADELTRLRRICNAMPAAAADGPGISIEEAMEHV